MDSDHLNPDVVSRSVHHGPQCDWKTGHLNMARVIDLPKNYEMTTWKWMRQVVLDFISTENIRLVNQASLVNRCVIVLIGVATLVGGVRQP